MGMLWENGDIGEVTKWRGILWERAGGGIGGVIGDKGVEFEETDNFRD